MANVDSSKWLGLKRPEVAGFERPLTSYRESDPLRLPAELVDVLRHFDGRQTAEVHWGLRT
jgi:hypothetical protein